MTLTTDEALAFLAAHRQMPEDSSSADVERLSEIRLHLRDHPDPRALPLVLGLFGGHMGWGVFQLFDDVLAQFEPGARATQIAATLNAPDKGSRWWAAHWALAFPSAELVPSLLAMLTRAEDEDAHYYAIAALGDLAISSPEVVPALRRYQSANTDPDRGELLSDLLQGP